MRASSINCESKRLPAFCQKLAPEFIHSISPSLPHPLASMSVTTKELRTCTFNGDFNQLTMLVRTGYPFFRYLIKNGRTFFCHLSFYFVFSLYTPVQNVWSVLMFRWRRWLFEIMEIYCIFNVLLLFPLVERQELMNWRIWFRTTFEISSENKC